MGHGVRKETGMGISERDTQDAGMKVHGLENVHEGRRHLSIFALIFLSWTVNSS